MPNMAHRNGLRSVRQVLFPLSLHLSISLSLYLPACQGPVAVRTDLV